MSDSAASAPVAATGTPVKASSGKKTPSKAAAKKPKSKPAHPPTGEMVNAAIAGLKERGGSSLQAIKKYIAANYKVDSEKLAPFIKKYLKSAVASGALSQPKGKGASGSFKITVKGEGKAAGAKKPKASKPAKAKKPAATSAAAKPKSAAAKKKTAKKPKSPTKIKKASKPPTKKPKSPKPKKAAVKKPKTPKKTTSKKK